MNFGIERGARCALAAAAMVSLAGVASAQQGQGERNGIGGRPATSARPDSGATNCRDAVRATCTPSGETRGVAPGGGDSGAPMTGSTGSSGTGATQGGNNPSPTDSSKASGGR